MNSIAQDLNRDIYSLFGLPADNLTINQAIALLHEKTRLQNNFILSTININWITQSLKDPSFRSAIINSDIVTLDGKPLLWLANLFGYPMTEIVPGSTLIQELLLKKTGKPLSIFLFGGENNVGIQAMQNINSLSRGLKAVGALNPGFGTISEMSTDTIIAEINKTNPDILLVALGAKKGTEWIVHNRDKLNAKIISHLGATINFLAGTVQRAPKLLNRIGIEWIWRILQEPKLFTRYLKDGLTILSMLFSHSISILRFIYWQKVVRRNNLKSYIFVKDGLKATTLSIKHNKVGTYLMPPREAFSHSIKKGKDIILDLKHTIFLTNSIIGLLTLTLKHQRLSNRKIFIVNANQRINAFLKFFVFFDPCPPNLIRS